MVGGVGCPGLASFGCVCVISALFALLPDVSLGAEVIFLVFLCSERYIDLLFY